MQLLRLGGAVAIGLASMIGAGVFVSFGPAAALAGSLLPFAIGLASLIALVNAFSMAGLARVLPVSGGAYSYASQLLRPWIGFTAGAAFLIGKIGSVAAIALVVVNYLGLPGWSGILVLGLTTGINVLGINRTALGAKILAGISVSFLVWLIGTSFSLPAASKELDAGDLGGVLAAAGLMFFAFAGYARVATLGSEVESPEVNIPRAILFSLGIVTALYLILGAELSRVLGASLTSSATPIADLAELTPAESLTSLVAAVAGLGSLLALLAGMGRTASVMASEGELPKLLAAKNRFQAPWPAELVIGVMASILLLSGGLIFAISLSSFAVLTYYAIANLTAALRLSGPAGPAGWLGLALCVTVGLSLEYSAVVLGTFLLLAMLGVRALAKARRSS